MQLATACHCAAMPDAITLASDRMTATISPYGARLETLCFEGGLSLVLHADPGQHPTWRGFYPGAIVGPVANRVRGGGMVIDGQSYRMPCNENGVTALHSGPDGLDRRMWQTVQRTDSDAQLCCVLAAGDGGLPGNRTITVHYALEGATLTLMITATTDAPTPISIAHHPYWRLGCAADHRLTVRADHYLPVDDLNLPTGQIVSVTGTGFDFRTPRALPPWIDHNLCLSDQRHATPHTAAVLTGSDGLRMTLKTTEAGLQVYGGAYLPTLPGTDIAPHAGTALEPQGWPDAVNTPGFPPVIATAARPFKQITQYCFDRAT